MIAAADKVIPPGWTSLLQYGTIGIAGLIAAVLIYAFVRGKSPSASMVVLAVAGFLVMGGIAAMSSLTTVPADPKSEDHAALSTLCELETTKLSLVQDPNAQIIGEQMRRVINRRVPLSFSEQKSDDVSVSLGCGTERCRARSSDELGFGVPGVRGVPMCQSTGSGRLAHSATTIGEHKSSAETGPSCDHQRIRDAGRRRLAVVTAGRGALQRRRGAEDRMIASRSAITAVVSAG